MPRYGLVAPRKRWSMLPQSGAGRPWGACFIRDTVFFSEGVHVDPAGFLGSEVDAVRRCGGLLISDELQPAFGRSRMVGPAGANGPGCRQR